MNSGLLTPGINFFFFWLPRVLWHVGSSLAALRPSSCGAVLVAPWPVGSEFPRDQTFIPCSARRILNHRTTREVPRNKLLPECFQLEIKCNRKEWDGGERTSKVLFIILCGYFLSSSVKNLNVLLAINKTFGKDRKKISTPLYQIRLGGN